MADTRIARGGPAVAAPLLKAAAGLALVAVRSFLGTLLAVGFAGVVLAAASAYLLRGWPVYAWVAAGVALAESLVAGSLLGGRRAVVMALVHGVRTHRVGRSAVRFLFERLLGVTTAGGGGLARAADRLPLAEAERRLAAVVGGLIGEGGGGWVRRRIQARLLAGVEKYTLSRFREQGAGEGGVDLARMQAVIEETVDDRLVGRLRAGLNLWTMLVVCGLPATVFAETYLAIALLHVK